MITDKKEYLNQYSLQQAKINRLNQMIYISPDKKDALSKEIEACMKLRDEIEFKIKKVDNGILSELLFQKYVLEKSLLEISYTLNYSKRQIERLHIKAIDLFEI